MAEMLNPTDCVGILFLLLARNFKIPSIIRLLHSQNTCGFFGSLVAVSEGCVAHLNLTSDLHYMTDLNIGYALA